MAAHDCVDAMKPFDYAAAAELLPVRNRKFNRQFTRYGQFDNAAEALRFAIEELPPLLLLGAFLEAEEERLDKTVRNYVFNIAQTCLWQAS
jgi:hypothetical protein